LERCGNIDDGGMIQVAAENRIREQCAGYNGRGRRSQSACNRYVGGREYLDAIRHRVIQRAARRNESAPDEIVSVRAIQSRESTFARDDDWRLVGMDTRAY